MNIIDLHCDTLSECFFQNYPLRQNGGHISIEKLKKGGALAQYPTFLADWRWSKIADSPLPSAIEGEKGAILIGKWDTMSPLTLCLRGQEPKPIPIEDETSPLYAELDAFISMIKRRGGNEGYLSISLATCRVLDEIAKQNKITFRQTCWNMVVHRDD